MSGRETSGTPREMKERKAMRGMVRRIGRRMERWRARGKYGGE